MTLTSEQLIARDLLLQEKETMLKTFKVDEELTEQKIEELYNHQTRLKFFIENVKREIKDLKEMK